jgi:hypothetical protein
MLQAENSVVVSVMGNGNSKSHISRRNVCLIASNTFIVGIESNRTWRERIAATRQKLTTGYSMYVFVVPGHKFLQKGQKSSLVGGYIGITEERWFQVPGPPKVHFLLFDFNTS